MVYYRYSHIEGDKMPEPKFYSPREVADIYGVTRITVYKWIRTGVVKALKVGRIIRISNDSLPKTS